MRAHVPLQAGMALLAVTLAGCGGAIPTRPGPLEAPTTWITVGVTPAPVKVTFVKVSGTTATYRVAADVTFTELGGTGGRITMFTSSISHAKVLEGFNVTLMISSTTPASIDVPALGTTTYSHAQEFGVATDVSRVTWEISVSGIDNKGRAFAGASQAITLDLAVPAAAAAGS